jgi:membrane protease subunit HflK
MPGLQTSENKGVQGIIDALRVITVLGKVVVLLLAIGFLFSGVRDLEQHEMGMVMRFGDHSGDVRREPGLMFAWPYPIDEIIRVPAKRPQVMESSAFWYSLTDEEERTGEAHELPTTLKPGIDGYLITADRGLFHATCTLRYRITDPVRFMFDHQDAVVLLRSCLDRAMISAAVGMTAEQVLAKPKAYSDATAALLRQYLESMQLGIELDPLDMTLVWPRQLEKEIAAVADAGNEQQQLITDAKVYERRQFNEATTAASKLKFEANTWARAQISRADADAETFEKIREHYLKSPEAVRQLILADNLRDVVDNAEQVYLVNENNSRELRIDLTGRKTKKQDEGKE